MCNQLNGIHLVVYISIHAVPSNTTLLFLSMLMFRSKTINIRHSLQILKNRAKMLLPVRPLKYYRIYYNKTVLLIISSVTGW